MVAAAESMAQQDEAEFWEAFVEWHTESYRYAPKRGNFYSEQRYGCFIAGAEWQMKREQGNGKLK